MEEGQRGTTSPQETSATTGETHSLPHGTVETPDDDVQPRECAAKLSTANATGDHQPVHRHLRRQRQPIRSQKHQTPTYPSRQNRVTRPSTEVPTPPRHGSRQASTPMSEI